jgi:UrcA family protein
LYRRLERAAAEVCGGPVSRELRSAQVQKDCAVRALDQAVTAVGSPQLSARHARPGTGLL